MNFSYLKKRLNLLRTDGYNRPRKMGHAVDFFHLDAKHFPSTTKDLFREKEIAELGILPLGYKTAVSLFKPGKTINIGFLDPTNAERIRHVEKIVRERIAPDTLTGVKVYLILIEEYLEVLKTVYGIDTAKLRELTTNGTIGPLQFYLDNTSTL